MKRTIRKHYNTTGTINVLKYVEEHRLLATSIIIFFTIFSVIALGIVAYMTESVLEKFLCVMFLFCDALIGAIAWLAAK